MDLCDAERIALGSSPVAGCGERLGAAPPPYAQCTGAVSQMKPGPRNWGPASLGIVAGAIGALGGECDRAAFGPPGSRHDDHLHQRAAPVLVVPAAGHHAVDNLFPHRTLKLPRREPGGAPPIAVPGVRSPGAPGRACSEAVGALPACA